MQFGLIRRLAASLIALAVACAVPAAAQPAPYTIPVVLSLSGQAAQSRPGRGQRPRGVREVLQRKRRHPRNAGAF